MRMFVLLVCFCFCTTCYCQQGDSLRIRELEEVNIKAFHYNKNWKEVPAAINYVSEQTLQMFGSTSIVSAVNTTPGVKLEERSPGSYRINIRGSTLRSPFGVRNVKVYLNDIPLTDPGGHTYFNQLGSYNFSSLEIIKGPGSSIYGAGTGGSMLISTMNPNEEKGLFIEYAAGSYNQQNIYASLVTKGLSKISLQHQQNDGYRQHSKIRRDVITWTGNFKLSEKQHFNTTFLYGDLFYETPGALTLSEFKSNARMSRPGAGTSPGAAESKAAVYQKTFLAGLSYTQNFTEYFSNQTLAYAAFTSLENPTLRNYAKSKEPHAGARTIFSFQKTSDEVKYSFNVGFEIQQNFTSVNTFKNNSGNSDTLQLADEIHTGQHFAFAQALVAMDGWELMAGSSVNQSEIKFTRSYPSPQPTYKRKFNNEFAPRVSLSRHLKNILVYTSVSRGFSPPASPELLPSGNNFNYQLNAEHGINFDAGVKGVLYNKLLLDINAFTFTLQNTIVQRRDAAGGDFFVNAGKTKQYGIETSAGYPLFFSKSKIKRSIAWLSHTWHKFSYKEFKQVNNDFSGKRIPGVAPHVLSGGIDIEMKNGWLGSVSYLFSDKLPLNDANTEYAANYHLITIRTGYQFGKKYTFLKIIAGIDNFLNESYSLGNDVNGFGGRYYNAATGRNYYVSLSLRFNTKN